MYKITQSLLVAAMVSFAANSFAQVGIGTTTPDNSASLEILSTNSGLLLPRVALTNVTNGTTPVNTPATSLLVYNTNAGITGGSGTGFYYWDGSEWVKLATRPSSDWTLLGNTGTNANTNFIGTTDAVDFVARTNNSERFRVLSTGNTGFGTTTPASTLSVAANATIGNTYASANIAPADGLRVEGQTVIGKDTGEDSRDVLSAHTSTTSFNNVTGYGGDTANRAIAGYSDGDGIGVLGYATRTGYGVVGLAHANTISSFVQQGEGVLGQADGRTGNSSIPIGVHGIIDEAAAGTGNATPVLGENNNATVGVSLTGGAYNTTVGGVFQGAVSGTYGNIGTRASALDDAYQFGVIGDILLLGPASQPYMSGGILGTNASGDFGILGYKAFSGTLYSVYGGGAAASVAAGNTGKMSSQPNATVGLGINGGFMGGYVKGSQYGLLSRGEEFGMYVQGKTITNQPVVQLIDSDNSHRTITYANISTSVDVNTRGKAQLNNGEAFVSFSKDFINIVSNNDINITVTPTGATNGVYVSKVTQSGFYVKENLNGTNNATFNWTAIGTRKGYENGVKLSETILSNNFDKNMNEVMFNDGQKKQGDGQARNKAIHFDGKKVIFDEIPNGIIKYNKKVANKK